MVLCSEPLKANISYLTLSLESGVRVDILKPIFFKEAETMKMLKRAIVTAVALAMAATSLVACGKKSTNKSDEREFVKLDCYSQLANYQGTQTGWFAAVLKEKFNVELNIMMETGNTFSTLMEQGDLGDMVIFGSMGDDYMNAISANMLYDWESYDILDNYGSYIKENMPAALQYNRETSGNDTIYGIGHSIATSADDHDSFFYSWDLRYDYYQELGCPEIKTLDDLADVLAEMKKNHPTDDNGKETYGISIWPDWDGNLVMYVKALATAYYGYDELALGLYNNQTGEFYDALKINDDGTYGPYLEMLQFFNKLYQRGLLDPDSDIQTYDDCTAKYKTGRAFWSIFNYAGSLNFNSAENIEAGKAMLPVAPEDATPCVYGMNVRGGNRVWAIGATSEYPDRVMEIYNWLCTPKGWLTQQYGPEGLCWYYAENDKGETKTYFTDLGAKCKADVKTEMVSDDEQYQQYTGKTFKDGQQQMNNITWAVGAINPETNETYDSAHWESTSIPPAAGSIEAQWREWSGAINADDYLEKRGKYSVAVASDYKEGKQDKDLKIIWKQVTQAIVDGTWLAIEANSDAEFEKAVNTMIANANSYDNGDGYNKCVEWSVGQAKERKAREDAVLATTK